MTVRVFDKTKPMPEWVRKHNGRRRRYWIRLWHAQPLWADPKQIRQVYHNAARLRKGGRDMVVDHIIPLNGYDVCGLHVVENLQIITRPLNDWLGDRIWPGQPCEQLDMFGLPDELKRSLRK